MPSQADRNTLIKFVASANPVYNMLVLHLPTKTSDSIDKMLRAFWWVDIEGKMKVHTIKCDELCKPISESGLGIRDTKSNNLALLAKT